jgi:hypothetical protein
MTTVRKTASKNKASSTRPLRFMAWLSRLARGQGILRIRLKHSETRTEEDVYFCHPMTSGFGGEAFRLERWDAASQQSDCGIHVSYDVHLAGQGSHSSCECKGFLRWGHCKHVEALEALAASGKL